MKYKYNIALSFAGEDREYVEKVARSLRKNDVSVFYDRFETADLWGKNLVDHLYKIYCLKSRYAIIFVSEHYAKKTWTNHEKLSALERAFKEKREYILPARFDETIIPGLSEKTAYIDLKTVTPHQLTKLILQKLGKPWNAEEAHLNTSDFSLMEKTSLSEMLALISIIEESLHLLESLEDEFGLADYEAFHRIFMPDFENFLIRRQHILDTIPESLSGPRDQMMDGILPEMDHINPKLSHRTLESLIFQYNQIYSVIYRAYWGSSSVEPVKEFLEEIHRLLPTVRAYIMAVINEN